LAFTELFGGIGFVLKGVEGFFEVQFEVGAVVVFLEGFVG
jgi:hypothetical protein